MRSDFILLKILQGDWKAKKNETETYMMEYDLRDDVALGEPNGKKRIHDVDANLLGS